MKWTVSVFTANGGRLIWASSAVPNQTEAIALANEAIRHGCKTFVRSPFGQVTSFEPGVK